MKLGIKASSIGLNLVGVWEDGVVYTKDVLDVDVDEYREMVERAAGQAFNLAFNSGYPVKEVLELLLIQAHNEALNLGVNANIFSKDTIEGILSIAHGHALALKSATKIE